MSNNQIAIAAQVDIIALRPAEVDMLPRVDTPRRLLQHQQRLQYRRLARAIRPEEQRDRRQLDIQLFPAFEVRKPDSAKHDDFSLASLPTL